jgi:hypothetical protein
MNPDKRNACPPDGHDWTASLTEAGVEVCAWPGCNARRDASPAPIVGVDIPASSMDVGRRAA